MITVELVSLNPRVVEVGFPGPKGDGVAVFREVAVATDTGIADAITASQASGKTVFLPPTDYVLGADVVPASGAISFLADPKATFSGTGKLRFGNVIPYIPQPVYAPDLYSKSYGAEWNGHKNIFQRASVAKATVARGGVNIGPAVVALFGSGEAAAADAAAWGANIVGYSSVSGGVAIANETDSGALVSGGIAYNTVLVAVGDYPTENFLQMQANKAGATAKNGIVFNYRSTTAVDSSTGETVVTDIQPVSGSYFKGDGGTAVRLMDFAQNIFTTSEWESRGFIVGPSPNAAAWNYLRIDGDTAGNPKITAKATDGSAANFNYYTTGIGKHQFLTGATAAIQVQIKDTAGATDRLELTGGSGDVTITTAGSSTNSAVSIQGKGSSGVKIRDGAGALKIQVSTTGVGFFAATPSAKPTVTGSRGANAALASLLTALAGFGLLTDSSSA